MYNFKIPNETLFSNSLAVVIATQNRTNNLNNLLDSLNNNSRYPDLIVIISSGVSVESIVSKYSNLMNILHEHVEMISQSYQKNIGLQRARLSHDFILFLDDYFTLDKNFFDKCYSITKNLSKDVMGVGLKIDNLRDEKHTHLKLRLKFRSHSKNIGSVTRSGFSISYQESQNELQTSWLSSLSLWRSSVFEKFKFADITSRYSALEDLIFSYPIGKKYELIFCPKLKVYMDYREISNSSYVNRAFYTILHRRYFIKKNSEFSVFLFYVNSFSSTLYHLLNPLNKIHRQYFKGCFISLLFLLFFEIFNFFNLIEDEWLIHQ